MLKRKGDAAEQETIQYYEQQLRSKDEEINSLKNKLPDAHAYIKAAADTFASKFESCKGLLAVEIQRRKDADVKYTTHIEVLKAEHQSMLNAMRMAYASQLAQANEQRQLLVGTIDQRVQEKLQQELNTAGIIESQLQIIELKRQRLNYVTEFKKTYHLATGSRKLPKPVEWLARDFMSNELLEEIMDRPLTIGKVAFEQRRYDLTLERLIKAGIYASDRYLQEHGTRPPKFARFVNGNASVEVNYYTDDDRWIIEDALKREWGDSVGLPR